jgi:hypothetical protein
MKGGEPDERERPHKRRSVSSVTDNHLDIIPQYFVPDALLSHYGISWKKTGQTYMPIRLSLNSMNHSETPLAYTIEDDPIVQVGQGGVIFQCHGGSSSGGGDGGRHGTGSRH